MKSHIERDTLEGKRCTDRQGEIESCIERTRETYIQRHCRKKIHFEQTKEEKDTQTSLNERGIGLTFSSRKNNL